MPKRDDLQNVNRSMYGYCHTFRDDVGCIDDYDDQPDCPFWLKETHECVWIEFLKRANEADFVEDE